MSTLVEKLPIWPVSMATGGALLLTGGTVWRTAKTKPARRAIDVKIGIPPVHMHSAFDWDEACRIIAHPLGTPGCSTHGTKSIISRIPRLAISTARSGPPLRAAKVGSTA